MTMFQVFRKELQWCGRKLTLETGKIARQADGSVIARMGDTSVLCTVVGERKAAPDQDFFPLSVHYQEKAFAAGKIPGGYNKREGRPSEAETLTSRLIDRPIRPLFPEGFLNEVQVICTLLSHDMENEPDIVALIGTSAALCISGIPFMGPIGGARVGYINGELVVNPTITQMKESKLDLIVAGTVDGVLMVESEAQQLSEEIMLDAVVKGHQSFQPVIEAIIQLAETCAKPAWDLPTKPAIYDGVKAKLADLATAGLRDAYKTVIKQDRYAAIDKVKSAALATFAADAEAAKLAGSLFKELEGSIVRGQVLDTGKRIDGRDGKTIRQISSEVGVLPRTHGSALFTRGETQALVVATLGTGEDEQRIDTITGDIRESFLLHYNFPPYSVGETGRLGTPGRREIGHGKLAWRALRPLLPAKDKFPYTMRIVSEITESNGSSSMATVCGSSLALMDAGVPLAAPVAGIAMGLIKEDKKYAVISDILGDEDHLGDMDFKVAGTKDGITALQMDIKITSINAEIMKVALAQAKEGRLHILGEMAKALTGARDAVNQNAPRITTFVIPRDKIREVIGTGGKVIREICETTGAKVDIEDDGTIKVAAVDQKAADAAIAWIKGITSEPEMNAIYQGKVVKTVEFGAFVNFMGSRDGLVHISELAPQRVGKTTDIVNVGDQVWVKVIGFDDRGKIKLSMKQVDQATGAALSMPAKEKAAG
jgi:polyribonucleotide nucleotidyltransferase